MTSSIQLVKKNQFIGRQDAVQKLRAWLDDEASAAMGVVVLGGPGLGKTRLVSHVLAERGAQGAAFVCIHMAGVETQAHLDSALVAAQLADEGRAGCDGDDEPETLLTQLAARGGVLVLDGAEPALPLVEALVQRCAQLSPALRVWVTTRQRLRLSGLRVLELEPLEPAQASALFIDRVRLRRADFEPDVRALALIDQINAQQGYIPLAIELAAGRAHMMSLEQLLAQLKQRLDAVSQRSLDAPAHHRDMASATAWSWSRLDEPLQLAMQALAVFEGGFTMEAAQALLSGFLEDDPIDLVSQLCDSSMIRAFNPASAPAQVRLEILAPVRQFIRERHASGQLYQRALKEHARYFARWIELLMTHGDSQPAMWAALGLELDNLFAAYTRFMASEPTLSEAVAAGLLQVLSRHAEAKATAAAPAKATKLTQRLTAMSVELSTTAPYMASLLQRRAQGQAKRGQLHEALEDMGQALSLLSEADSPILRWSIQEATAKLLWQAGRVDEAQAVYAQAHEDAKLSDDEVLVLGVEIAWAKRLMVRADWAQAQQLMERAAARAKALGDHDRWCVVMLYLGQASRELGQHQQAQSALFQALNLSDLCLEPKVKAYIHEQLGALYRLSGDKERAFAHIDLAIEAMGEPQWGSMTYGRLILDRAFLAQELSLAEPALAWLEELAARHQSSTMRAYAQAALAAALGVQRQWPQALSSAEVVLSRLPARGQLAGASLLAGAVAAIGYAEQGDVDASLALMSAIDHSVDEAHRAWPAVLRLLMPPESAPKLSLQEVDVAQWRAALQELVASWSAPNQGGVELASLRALILSRAPELNIRLTQSLFHEPESQVLTPVADAEAWVVSSDSAQLLSPSGQLLQIHRPLLLRLMHHLVELRLNKPGVSIQGDELFAVGWPGERATAKSARNRLYAAIHTLRSDGFGALLKTHADGGYMLDPAQVLVRQGD